MIEIYGIKLSVEVAIFFMLFLVDELIPYLPVKGNNFLQVIQGLIAHLKFFRKEDDTIKAVKEKLKEIQDEVNRL